ncbi:MAG: GNAT family protein [Pyrinomonadaceae bacterium]|nr:GNAT family protein [Pyrinomonadaceae bacterium]
MFSYQIEKGLRLNLPELRHADELVRLVQLNMEHLKPWMPWAVEDYSQEHARQWIRRTLDEFAQDGRFNALILLDDKIVGTIGFHDLDTANRRAAIGYWIDKGHEGKGIITRCCRVLIDYLFDTMKLNRVQINCNVENVRSRAIPEKLGFRFEGTLREMELVNGRFGDWAIYGMLRSEWKGTDE